MEKCKKCGSKLVKAAVVHSVDESSIFKTIASEGDAIFAIDDVSVESQSDVKNVIEGKKFSKITVLHKDERVTTSALLPVAYLDGVVFEEGDVCIKCGAKQKSNKFPFILMLVSVLLIASVAVIFKTVGYDSEENTPPLTTVEKLEESSIFNKSIFSDEFNDLLKAELEDETIEQDNEKNESGNESSGESPELSSELFVFNNGDLNTFETIQNRKSGGRKGRRRKNPSSKNVDESPDKTIATPSFTLPKIPSDWTVRLGCRIYFRYGSSVNYLGKMEGSVETLFCGITDSTDRKEFSNVVKALEWLVQQIDENKRSEVKFYVDGYADSTFRNGIPTDSEESLMFNTELSKERSETVKSVLMKEEFNIPQDNIITTPHGYNIEEEKEYELWKFRRVDISVAYKDD